MEIPLMDPLAALISGFNVRRAFSLAAILMILGITAWIVDYYGDFSRLGRLEKATALLERLNALDAKPLSAELKPVRDQIAAELTQLTAPSLPPGDSGTFKAWGNRHWRKFVAGALPWLLLSFLLIPGVFKGEASAIGGLAALLLLTVFFGAFSAAIPPVGNRLIDYLLVPGGMFVFVALIPISAAAFPAMKKVRESTKQRAIMNNLRQISAAADQYFLEHGQAEVSIERLVGPEPEKYIRALTPVDGESYRDMVIRQGEPISVVRASGEKIQYST